MEASHVPLGMHIEKVMLVQQTLETEEQAAKRRKSNKERVVETCSYMHGQYCYNMYVQAWSILQYNSTGMVYIQDYQGVSTDSLLTTHADYISDGFVGQGRGIVAQLGALLSRLYNFVWSQLIPHAFPAPT